MPYSFNFLVVLLTLFFQHVRPDLDFIHCLGPKDMGGADKLGLFFHTCVHDEHFHNLTYAWDFRKSLVKDTKFTKCMFADSDSQVQNFTSSTWRNVLFSDCDFGKASENSFSEMTFVDSTFENVTFEDCRFHYSQHWLFERFSLSEVSFKNCTFHNEMWFNEGRVHRLSLIRSALGPHPHHESSSATGNFHFSRVAISTFTLERSIGTAEIRMQEAAINNLQVFNTTLSSIICHEQIDTENQFAPKVSTLNDTAMRRVTLLDGLYCGNGQVTGMFLRNLHIGAKVDLSKARIEGLTMINASSLYQDGPARFCMEESTVYGAFLSGLNLTSISFKKSFFVRKVFIKSLAKLSSSTFELEKAQFSQELINRECCMDVCKEKGCECDRDVIPKAGCPVGNAILHSATESESSTACFPQDSVVRVHNNDGSWTDTPLLQLRHGQKLISNHGEDPSEVFFFAHKTRSSRASYRVLRFKPLVQNDEGVTPGQLFISGNHMLPVRGKGLIPSKKVIVGDFLFTVTGENAVVVSVRSILKEGLFAPVTHSGFLSVDGIQVSSYTDIVSPSLTHFLLGPLRLLHRNSMAGKYLVYRLSAACQDFVMRYLEPNWNGIPST